MSLKRLLLCLVALASPAFAAIGVLDDVPAATLLIPYFEVDLSSPTGRTTVVHVRATDASATLTHVTLWSDQGVPVLGFNAYLTGFDSYSFDLREVLAGNLPITASDGQDGADTLSPQGDRSQDLNFNSCAGSLPPQPLATATTDALKLALTGKASPLLQGLCAGRDLGDNVARGFITIDTMNACTTTSPGSPGYFNANGSGVAAYVNHLTGHFTLIDPANKTTRALSAVHLEASTTDGYVNGPMASTFYSRLNGSQGDRREPLAQSWTAPARKGASLLVWRDVRWSLTGFDCAQGPAALPAAPPESLVLWDTQENPTDLSALLPFPASASLTTVGSEALPTLARSGFLNFHGGLGGSSGVRQAYVATFDAAERGQFVSGVRGAGLDSAALPDPGGGATNISSTFRLPSVHALDTAPAASLLLPSFEVDLDDPNRSNTVVRVTNVVADAVLVNVTLWTDLGVPTRNFPLYLTGFDQAELDLRLLFRHGLFERTATDGQDPRDDISPQGPHSQDINFASCSGVLPGARLTATALSALQQAHTGKATALFAGKCAGSVQPDNVARGYLTFDLVTQCRTPLPNAAGYDQTLDSRNTLTGDFMITNRLTRTVLAEALVALHARPPSHPAFVAGQPRFYGRYTAHQGINREPLPSHWEVPFDQTGTGTTSLVVWREPDLTAAPFTCGQAPTGQPGATGEVVAFDEQENATVVTSMSLARVSTRVEVGAGGLAVPYQRGFLQLDLDDPTGTGGPPGQPLRRQGFVMAMRSDPTGGTGWVQNAHPLPFAYPRPLVEAVELQGFTSANNPGAVARFVVRLDAAPSADVTVALSAPAGAQLSPPSVVLTAANAFAGVQVTVSATGQVGFMPLGEYTVSLGAAVSTDARFSGFDATDVSILHRN